MSPDGRDDAAAGGRTPLAERAQRSARSSTRSSKSAAATQPTLYKPHDYSKEPYKWGMAIDLNKCTGCNACVVACQSENNIPVVGKEQRRQGPRDALAPHRPLLHGRRSRTPRSITQPLACVHCETAPCEYVCPVNATVAQRRRPQRDGLQPLHRHAVLQQQLPVQGAPLQLPRLQRRRQPARADGHEPRRHRAQPRRHGEVHLLRAAHRAQAHRRRASRGAPSQDGELQTACQQACPTQAIVFGSLNDPNAQRVASCTRDARRYDLLHELGTRPRTAYLARVRNPNPELARLDCSMAAPHPAMPLARPARAASRSSRATQTDRTINDSLLDHVWRGAGQGLVGAASACALSALGLLVIAITLHALQGHRRRGATTSPSAGPSASSTSSGGSASATPAR